MLLSGRFAHLAVWRRSLRVLCYHHVDPGRKDRFCVTPSQLAEQIDYLIAAGFTFIHVKDLLGSRRLPERPVLLTFDDGYRDNVEYAMPVLQRRKAKATFFVVTGRSGCRAEWDDRQGCVMTVDEMRCLDPELAELALHSHSHRPFTSLTVDDIEEDLKSSLTFFARHGLPFCPAVAYPYGSRPVNRMNELSATLAGLGIKLAFRVGNRVNRLPLACHYDIQRIDVSGAAGMLTFRRKLWLGRL